MGKESPSPAPLFNSPPLCPKSLHWAPAPLGGALALAGKSLHLCLVDKCSCLSFWPHPYLSLTSTPGVWEAHFFYILFYHNPLFLF